MGNRRERPIALIVCEGEATEPNYFNGLVAKWRLANIHVRPARGSAPMTIVDDAIIARSERTVLAQRSNAFLPYDDVWCVFDVDEHPKLQQAVAKASSNGVLVALSNPSFELWLVLHFERYAVTNTSRQKVLQRLRKYLTAYDKGKDYCEQLFPNLAEAISRAEISGERNGRSLIPQERLPAIVTRVHWYIS